MSLCDWLISLSMVSSRFTCVVACVSFLPPCTGITFPPMRTPGFVYPFICTWTLGLCPVLVPVKNAAVDAGVQYPRSCLPSGRVLRSGIAGSCINSVLSF